MKFFLRLICVVWFILLLPNVYAQTQPKSPPNTTNNFESVWLWQVDTPGRRVYIAGDWHDHFLSSKENISHRLAYSAYELSSRVLTESVGTKHLGQTLLENRLKPQTWQTLDAAVRKALTKKMSVMKNLSTEQRNIPIDDVVSFVNRLPDNLLAATLPSLLLPQPENEEEQLRIEIGFLKKITFDVSKEHIRKLDLIETTDAVDKVWSKNCGQPSDSESLVREVLTETGSNAQQTERRIKQEVSEFRSTKATPESMAQLVENSVYWNILNKCSVLPRNLEWMKKIKAELSNDEQPLMIVVGIAHVVGDTGLLSLLCKEGYCQSKRVHLADFVKKQ